MELIRFRYFISAPGILEYSWALRVCLHWQQLCSEHGVDVTDAEKVTLGLLWWGPHVKTEGFSKVCFKCALFGLEIMASFPLGMCECVHFSLLDACLLLEELWSWKRFCVWVREEGAGRGESCNKSSNVLSYRTWINTFVDNTKLISVQGSKWVNICLGYDSSGLKLYMALLPSPGSWTRPCKLKTAILKWERAVTEDQQIFQPGECHGGIGLRKIWSLIHPALYFV